jgi:hypothetical protein
MAVDDRKDGQARFVHPYIRQLEEDAIKEEGVIF